MTPAARITKVIQKDEIYPNNCLSGCPALTYRQAVCIKAQQERYLKSERNTVEIHLEIKPVPNREDEYYVHNTSTYYKDVTSLKNLNKINLPPWVKQDSDGNIQFMSVAPLYMGTLQTISSAYTETDVEQSEA